MLNLAIVLLTMVFTTTLIQFFVEMSLSSGQVRVGTIFALLLTLVVSCSFIILLLVKGNYCVLSCLAQQ